jgi:hypothetical protein
MDFFAGFENMVSSQIGMCGTGGILELQWRGFQTGVCNPSSEFAESVSSPRHQYEIPLWRPLKWLSLKDINSGIYVCYLSPKKTRNKRKIGCFFG